MRRVGPEALARRWRVVVVVLAAIAVRTTASATPGEAVHLEDPRYDDHGPGSYIYPTGPWYQRRGLFDLRSFRVIHHEHEVEFRVRLELPFERPDRVMINPGQELPLTNSIFFQNIDIFVDHTPGVGETEGIPGRNVQFRPSEAWDFALVITPRPDLVRQILRKWPPAKRLLVADNVRSQGTEVWATVPAVRVGGFPTPDDGYQVVVSGTLHRNNFEVFERVTDVYRVDALTIPVFGVAEREAFGGGDLSRWQPRAIDILAPRGITQGEILGHYDHESRDFAVLPMVYPSGKRPLATTATLTVSPGFAPSPEAAEPTDPGGLEAFPDDGFVYTRVREVYEQMAILESTAVELQPYRVGTVIGDQGQELGRLVVTAIYPDFIQATIVEGQDRVEKGARVRFDPQKE